MTVCDGKPNPYFGEHGSGVFAVPRRFGVSSD